MTRCKWFAAVLLQLSVLFTKAQLSEDFSDGNYTSGPVWSGTPGSWIVNASGQLQSNNTVANSFFYLSTPSTMATETQWEFSIHLAFNTSSVNYADIYLVASAADLSAPSTSGYFIRIGGTPDEISLYRKDAGGIESKVIDGADGITDKSNNTIRVKVVRDRSNHFRLWRDLTGTGNSYVYEGEGEDPFYVSSSFFGVLIRQSTANFFQKHFIDDISIQSYMPDVLPPSLIYAKVVSSDAVDLLFSEPLDVSAAQDPSHYTAGNNIGSAVSAIVDAANQALVHLRFAGSFNSGISFSITIDQVSDMEGNILYAYTTLISNVDGQRYDLIIDEIMADPSPAVGLPEAEYVEIKNTTGHSINLAGYRLRTDNATGSTFPDYDLPSGSFLILCSNANADVLSAYGNVLGMTSFPALTNTGTTLSILSAEGRVIHAVRYSLDAYQSTIKAAGGWSLEMVDTDSPCSGIANWKASTDESGGTPGRRNAVDGVYEDNTPPRLWRTFSVDSVTVMALFNESLDSLSATISSAYTFTGIPVKQAEPQGPLFTSVLLKLATPMMKGQVYTLIVNGVTDCKGNAIGASNHAKAGVPQKLSPGDVVVNEILFNPRPGASDYIECYNRSNKIADLHRLYIANRTAAGSLGTFRQIADTGYYLFPGDYTVLTEDPPSLAKEYLVKDPSSVISVSAMPSYPDDKGDVVVADADEYVIDEVPYNEKWHFALISNTEGIALERVDPAAPSANASGWHSAASTAGYGTPGYINSQYKSPQPSNTIISIDPKVFSPDNDGHDDIATIFYQLKERGYVGNITVFDASGRLVRYLVKNDLLGLQGSWTWDGLDEQGRKLPAGIYIIYSQIFDLKGNRLQFKDTIVLGRKM